MVVYTCNPSPKRARQEALEFEVSLVYIASKKKVRITMI
jgi:hypothetical protein